MIFKKLKKVNSKNDLQTLKSEYFGKNGIVTSEFKKMGSLFFTFQLKGKNFHESKI